jgi:hypothetical protein
MRGSSKNAFPLVILEAIVAGIPDNIENLEAFKDETVERSLREDRWQKKLPPTAKDLRDGFWELIYELCLAREVRALLPDSYADRLWAVTATIGFLRITGFPEALIKPLMDLIGDLEDLTQAAWRRGKPGKPMPFNKLVRGVCAAAAVTALSEKGSSVPEALRMVCKKSGFEQTWLRDFRLNILRGNIERASRIYGVALAKCREGAPAAILKWVGSC